jgi:DNA replication protein DnaC
MLQQPMKEKLQALKLQGMLEALEKQEQEEAARELSFLDRLALLVDQQWNWRQNQALTRRVRASRLKGTACVEDIDYRAERGLSKSVIRALAQESGWVANHEHIFVLGPTGVGKSYVASALAQKACRDGYAVYYTRTAALFRDLNLARADGSLRHLLKRLNRIDVLVVDDWAMAPMSEAERNCRFRAGTSRSAIPRWPTASWTVWCTTRTASRCAANRCARNGARKAKNELARRSKSCGKDGPKPPLEIAPQKPLRDSHFPTAPTTTNSYLTMLITFWTMPLPASLRSDD